MSTAIRVGAARLARRGTVIAMVLLAVDFGGASAFAQTESTNSPSAVEDHLERGIELRKEGRDADALAEFRAAYQLDKSPRVRAQIAVAEQALGNWLEAERGLVIVLATHDDPWIEEWREALEQALVKVRARLGFLVVQSSVAGAELRLDGVRIADLPTAEPIRIVAGTHTLEVRAEGYVPARRIVDVSGNSRVQELFVLTALPIAGVEPLRPIDSTEKSGEEASLKLSTATWISAASLAGLLVAGGTALAVREINVATYNDTRRCVVAPMTRDQRCGSYRDAADTAELVAIGALTGAGVAAVATGFFFFRDITKSRRVETSLGCGPAGLGVTCAGTF
jgi:PEGA domain